MTSKTISELNDRFRKGDTAIPGRMMITSGVQSLVAETDDELGAVLMIVRNFDAFSTDNDPHGEHDFGAFDFAGEKLFWKIDYYSNGLQSGSEDPADISQTMRVLTIMLASEY